MKNSSFLLILEVPHTTINSEFRSEQSEERNRNLRLLKEEVDANGNTLPDDDACIATLVCAAASLCSFITPVRLRERKLQSAAHVPHTFPQIFEKRDSFFNQIKKADSISDRIII